MDKEKTVTILLYVFGLFLLTVLALVTTWLVTLP